MQGLSVHRMVGVELVSLFRAVFVPDLNSVGCHLRNNATLRRSQGSHVRAVLLLEAAIHLSRDARLNVRCLGILQRQGLCQEPRSHHRSLPFDHALKWYHVPQWGETRLGVWQLIVNVLAGDRADLSFLQYVHILLAGLQLARERQRAVCDVIGRLGFGQAALRVDDLRVESAVTALHGVAGQPYVDTGRETFWRAEIVDQSQLRWIYTS